MVAEPRLHSADSDSASPTSANIDPKHRLKPQMKVVGTRGKAIGKVDTIELDPSSGALLAITIRHGLLRRHITRIPAERVKHVNDDSVVLDFTPKNFKLQREVGQS